ncbi:MAG: hypothetical protein JJE52_12285 [Acidimicrobiia bacterium]|nr:hypothetical protein [Acidimicrobiia bacterium]
MAGAGTEPGDELAIGHDWWTPEWGVGTYIYPDFDLPVSFPVNTDDLILIVTPHDGPVEVTWQRFVDHADGLGDLPYYWTGRVYLEIADGEVNYIESPYSP